MLCGKCGSEVLLAAVVHYACVLLVQRLPQTTGSVFVHMYLIFVFGNIPICVVIHDI